MILNPWSIRTLFTLFQSIQWACRRGPSHRDCFLNKQAKPSTTVSEAQDRTIFHIPHLPTTPDLILKIVTALYFQNPTWPGPGNPTYAAWQPCSCDKQCATTTRTDARPCGLGETKQKWVSFKLMVVNQSPGWMISRNSLMVSMQIFFFQVTLRQRSRIRLNFPVILWTRCNWSSCCAVTLGGEFHPWTEE